MAIARTLWFKLMLAFGLVILIVLALVTIVSLRATAGQFDLYVSRQGEIWAEQLAPAIADSYARSGDWSEAQALVQQSGGEQMMGHGMMRGATHGTMMGQDVWSMMGTRVLIADRSGTVVGDSSGDLLGEQLSANDLANGTPLLVNRQQVGTLLVATLDSPSAPAGAFRRSVTGAVLLGGGLAALAALLLVTLFSLRVTRPLRRLSQAAGRIAAGDLSQQVPQTSQDEIGQLAGAFNAMSRSLQAMARERQHMVADIAHELRTPLAVIQSNLEAMLDGILPTNRQELASLHQEALLLNRLIGDLRTLSLAEAGQLALDRQPLDLGEIALRVAEKMQLQAAENGVTLETQLAQGRPQVLADPGRMEQVLVNLVDNAIRHAGAGRVTLGVEPAAGGVSAWVRDTGPGLSPAAQAQVFERFWRADKSRNRQTGGSGIGLALVKQLTEAHDGRVAVQSEPGAGSTFRIFLPAAAAMNTGRD